MGYRGRRYDEKYPGNGSFRGIHPWQRPGWLYGAGAVVMAETDTSHYQRFPWLPRRWEASPSLTGDIPASSAEQSKQIIEQRITVTEGQLATLRERLAEMALEEKEE